MLVIGLILLCDTRFEKVIGAALRSEVFSTCVSTAILTSAVFQSFGHDLTLFIKVFLFGSISVWHELTVKYDVKSFDDVEWLKVWSI